MKKKQFTLLLFILPSFCGLLIFYCIPFLLSFYYTLIDNMSTKQFIGFNNFMSTLKNPMFQRGLENTILFILISLPICIILALFIAFSYQKLCKGKILVAIILLIPLVIPSGTIIYFWKCIFDINGFANKLLYTFNLPIINWYNSKYVMYIAILIFLWKNIGFIVMLFVLGLNRIPVEYHEIAEIEGSTKLKTFFNITLVYLLPTILIAILLLITNSFKIFKEIYLLFGNYPHEKIYLLQHYMNNQFSCLDMQKLTSAAYILFLIISIIIYVLFRLQKKYSDTFTNLQLDIQQIHVKKTSYLAGGLSILISLLIILPLLFILSNSFMGSNEIINRYTKHITNYNINDLSKNGMHFVNMGIIPKQFTFNQYIELLLKSPQYLRLYWNSIFIAIPVLLGQLLISPLGAYAFEQIKWKHKEKLFFIYIIIVLMPLQVLLVPNYLVSNWFGFVNTYWAIILPGIFNPLGVFLIRLQLKGFPIECIEASENCGASSWQSFRYIILPNLKPSISILTILTFSEYWNVVDQAIVFIKNTYDQPLSVYLSQIVEGDLGMFFAVSCFYLVPILIVFFTGINNIVDESNVLNIEYRCK